MPELLKHVLKSLLENNDYLTSPAKNHAPNISTVSLIVEEMTNKKIATHLKLSPRTIEDYRANAMEKLAINTKCELALVWFVSQQLKLPLQ
ncbi:LuxR C-terminal-related transcriptional regulator [Gammaproteobacteria bacterium]|nr:LuxR C-terminal-related transcriptional regulator [Gammaproteobacteria bacterium]